MNKLENSAIILLALAASTVVPIGLSAVKVANGTGSYSVTIVDYAFQPLHINITTGTTVTWTYTSNGRTAHTVTSDPQTNVTQSGTPLISSGQLNPSQSFSYTFNLPGYYPYQCSLHPTIPAMNGWVNVTGNPVITQNPGPANTSNFPWIIVYGIVFAGVAVILVSWLFLRHRNNAKP